MGTETPLLSARSFFDATPNPLSRALFRARSASTPVLDLTESNPTNAGIPYDEDGIRAALSLPRRAFRYEPSAFGIGDAREAVACHLSESGSHVDPEGVVLTASTSEAYTFLFKLLADPGDEVLIPRPSYPLIEHLARLESVRCVPYRLAYDGAWHLDLSSVRAAMTSRTRAVVLVQPNNPTGSHLTHAELDAIGSLGVPLISDEVFSTYPLGDGDNAIASALTANAPLVFALGGLSKLAALPQLKLAWMAVGGHPANASAALARLELIADTFLSVATPVQLAASALLRTRGQAERAIRTRTRSHLAHVRDAVAGSPLSVLDVQAGWYATLRLPRTRSEEAWTLGLLEKESVYVHPGHFFDFEEEAYLVVSLLTPEAIFVEGVRRIVAHVKRECL